MADSCGWLIRGRNGKGKGDPNRPCVRKSGHKGGHRDQATNDDELARNREYHKSGKRASKKEYNSSPERKEKIRQSAANYRARNPEKVAAAKKKYVEANREKAYAAQQAWRRINPGRVKESVNAAGRKYYAGHTDLARQRHKAWAEANPEKVQAWHAANRLRLNALERVRKQKNPEARRESERRYRERHPELVREKYRRHSRRRKSKLRGIYHEDWTREQVITKYGNTCYLCRSGPYEETDHVIPLAKGGWDVLANLRPSCTPCNQRKRDKIIPVVAAALIRLVLSQVGLTWSDA